MENREILVANTRTQKRSKINTSATTLGELKQALQAAGIDYSGMTFTEGISKTQLISDDAQLPHDVIYKGQSTNNLVILLTNTKKNIASGTMSRKEVYQVIKQHHLQDAIKEEYGRNYTLVPTSDLAYFIEQNIDALQEQTSAADDCPEEDDDNSYSDDDNYEYEDVADTAPLYEKPRVNTMAEALNYLMDYFIHAGVLNYEQTMLIAKNMEKSADELLAKKFEGNKPVSTSDGNITDSDIDDMLNEINH